MMSLTWSSHTCMVFSSSCLKSRVLFAEIIERQLLSYSTGILCLCITLVWSAPIKTFVMSQQAIDLGLSVGFDGSLQKIWLSSLSSYTNRLCGFPILPYLTKVVPFVLRISVREGSLGRWWSFTLLKNFSCKSIFASNYYFASLS